MHQDAFVRGERVLLVDDVLATGGTVAAAARLVERCGAVVAGCSVLLELTVLHGRDRLSGLDVHALPQLLVAAWTARRIGNAPAAEIVRLGTGLRKGCDVVAGDVVPVADDVVPDAAGPSALSVPLEAYERPSNLLRRRGAGPGSVASAVPRTRRPPSSTRC